MTDNHLWALVIVGAALVIITGIIGITYSATNYDNKRMQNNYCEAYAAGNPNRLLVKCNAVR